MAGDLDALMREVDERLAAEADPKRAEHGEGYHATSMRIRGVRTPVLRSIAGDLARRLKAEPEMAIELAAMLVGSGGFEERTLGYILLSRHRTALSSLGGDRIEAFGVGMDNWASVDAYCSLVSGPAWLAGQVSDTRIDRWARSSDRWWRRAALVSTTALNKKRALDGRGDAARTLALCGLLAADRDDMVVKAVSWALRTLAARDPDAVRSFLDAHEDALAARVQREVRHKLGTGVKNPRRTQ
ncbi:MAG: DNA alkylation repair protein [Chloroflexi bacterium]|nr:DNA alkylation repair protein [Chloroflexota bacterium]